MRSVLIATAALAACACAAQERETEKPLAGKNVLMIIASQKFRDEELKEPREVLKSKGAEVVVASSRKGDCKGMLGAVEKVSKTLKEVKVSEYDAVLFVGGVGAQEYFKSAAAHAVAKKAYEGGAVVGAICIAPMILARAGLLKDKKATIWKGFAEKFKAEKVNYTGADVERVGRIVTANGPKVARKFGETVAKMLEKLLLRGRRIALFVESGVDAELLAKTRTLLDEAGAVVTLCGRRSGKLKTSEGDKIDVKRVPSKAEVMVAVDADYRKAIKAGRGKRCVLVGRGLPRGRVKEIAAAVDGGEVEKLPKILADELNKK